MALPSDRKCMVPLSTLCPQQEWRHSWTCVVEKQSKEDEAHVSMSPQILLPLLPRLPEHVLFTVYF